MTLPEVTIYTDGACSPNPGIGGWGAVLLKNGSLYKELSGREETTTNNRMELNGALQSLRYLKTPHNVTLITDSTYVKNGITSWVKSWKRRGWLTAAKEPVKNRDLWEKLDREISRHQVRWQWVRGHSQDPWNERADELAVAARLKPSGRRVDGDRNREKPVGEAIAVFCGITYAHGSGRGSWAVILTYRQYTRILGGALKGDSANQLHLRAAIDALSALKRNLPVILYTTSGYLRDGLKNWLPGWRRRGWLTSQGKPVSNRELWQQLSAFTDELRIDVRVSKREEGPCLLQEAKELAREWSREFDGQQI